MSLRELQTILVPVDFSPASRQAAFQASELAKVFAAEVMLLHVRPAAETSVLDNATGTQRERMARRLGELDRELRTWATGTGGGPYKTWIAQGEVAEVILEEAKRHDLIVMASHGREDLVDVLLGTTAERVIRASPCSVLLVR